MAWFNKLINRRRQSGFTLIELLVVVSIIALLVSILLPALNRARVQTRETMCMVNLKGLVMGASLYAADYDEYPLNYASKAGSADGKYGFVPYRATSYVAMVKGNYVAGADALQCPYAYMTSVGSSFPAFYRRFEQAGSFVSGTSIPSNVDYFYLGGRFTDGEQPWARDTTAAPDRALFSDYLHSGWRTGWSSAAGNHGPKGWVWNSSDSDLALGSYQGTVRGEVVWRDRDDMAPRWRFGTNMYHFWW